MRSIVVVAHNLRSCHNVGSLLRTAEGLGVDKIYLTGYTPFPAMKKDPRLPYLAQKVDKQIAKTALGAENTQVWEQKTDVRGLLRELRAHGFIVAALEQTSDALNLSTYQPPDKIALIVGREVEGVEPEILKAADLTLFIPMFGQKESFNVTQAAAMALYHCRFAK